MSVVVVGASPSQSRERPIRSIRNRHIAAGVLAGIVSNWLTDRRHRKSHLWTNVWIEMKRYGAPRVRNIELSRVKGIDRVRVDGPVWRHSPLVVTALSRLLECETLFQLGPDMGDTAWLLAHNLPTARIFVLAEGIAPAEQPTPGPTDRVYHLPRRDRDVSPESISDASRITQLAGDSATFNFLPYSGSADLVYIEGTRRPEQVTSDTEAAFGLLSELGTIVWDGYSGDPSLYAYLNELAPSLDRPIYHILDTRLALYSRWDIVTPDV
jgi:hypothetical protein